MPLTSTSKRSGARRKSQSPPQQVLDTLFVVDDAVNSPPNQQNNAQNNAQNNSLAAETRPIDDARKSSTQAGILKMVPREQINIHQQVRREAHQGVEDLRENISEMKNRHLGINDSGILQALLVTPSQQAGRYDLIAGERRYWASEGILDDLPVIVVPSNPRATLLMQGIENLKRRALAPLEESEFVAALRREQNLTIRDTAALLGEHKGWVENRVKVAGANPDIKELLSLHADSSGATLTNAIIIQNEKNPILRARLLRAAKDGATERILRTIIAAHRQKTIDKPSPVSAPQSAAVPRYEQSEVDNETAAPNIQESKARQTSAVLQSLRSAIAFATEAEQLLQETNASLDAVHREEIAREIQLLSAQVEILTQAMQK